MIDNRCVKLSNTFTSIFNLDLTCNQYKILVLILYYSQFSRITDISYKCFSELGTSRFKTRRTPIITDIKSMLEKNKILHDNICITFDYKIHITLSDYLYNIITADKHYYRIYVNDILKISSTYTMKMYFILKRNNNNTCTIHIDKFDEIIGNKYTDSKKYRYKVISRTVSELKDKLDIIVNIKSDRRFITMYINELESNCLEIENNFLELDDACLEIENNFIELE